MTVDHSDLSPRWFSRLRLRRDSPIQAARAAMLGASTTRDRGHALVWLAFADDPDARRDFLFRETTDWVYCVSARPPVDDGAVWEIETKAYDPAPPVGMTIGFSLRAAPMVSIKTGRRLSAKVNMVARAREALRAEDPAAAFGPDRVRAAALPWLLDRAAGIGLAIDEATLRVDGYRHDRLPRQDGPPIRFASIDYEGTALVSDTDAVRRALLLGVGRGKAYGCGLLLIRPLGREAE
ncbi:type I-E CRISPR-associated protein Cas6/Cse3/CasE [Magnetospirillum molischianum]|uniref:CRISPR-associated protein, Cse3 family n=1 Tax=Magnetospirillum molischianum DSM 120 TaxID=1150626 RepID=H8FVT7_MAGML|nr:type I-E CRISPR-associated protein Cas6/Cse3/CasE [Magnetospirillum molischianum]CCG42475.1 conserved hypothetical protein [Magnetospirillum molischianum DSM 120]